MDRTFLYTINNMSKKTTYIIIFVFLGLVLLGLVGYYFISRDAGDGTSKPNVFRNFFPFGGNENTENNTGTTTPEVGGGEIEKPVDFVAKLRKLSSEPVAGAGTLDVKAGTIVRYIEKATGHIFEVELFSPRQGRISNTTIPQAYDAIWGNKNNSLMARYLKDDNRTIETYSLTVKDTATSTENMITGISFPEKIADISVFGSSVFYLVQNAPYSYGYISNFDGKNIKQIWNYPISELLSQYVNSKTVALTTKPEETTEGFLYFVDTGNGAMKKILGNIMGLSTLVSDDATKVFYLNQADTPQVYSYNLKDNTTEQLTPATFPEKCAWSKKNKNIVYCAVPDEYLSNKTLTSWYRGQIQLNDDIWKYDLENNTSTIVMGLSSESGESIDVIKPILSEGDQYLIFVNKKDNSLWSLDLSK